MPPPLSQFVAICRKSFVWNRPFRPGVDERLLSERYRCDHVFLSFTQLRTTKAQTYRRSDIAVVRLLHRAFDLHAASPIAVTLVSTLFLQSLLTSLPYSCPGNGSTIKLRALFSRYRPSCILCLPFLTHSFPVANSIDVSTSLFFNISD